MSETTGTEGTGAPQEPAAPSSPEDLAAETNEVAEAPNRRTLWIVAGIVLAVIALAAIWWFQGGVAVPEVTGVSQEQATTDLEAAGLAVGQTSIEATLGVAPGTVTGQTPAAGANVREGASVDLVVAALPTATVPDVVGKTGSEAEADLAVAGLRVGDVTPAYSKEVPAGAVVTQSPEGDTEVSVGSAVALEVSAGPEQGAVPDVTGLVSVDAEDTLESAGFKVKESSKESEDVAPGVVISQSPVAGTVAQDGTTVTITVSTGAPKAAEPAPPATDEGDQVETPAPEAPAPEAPTPEEPATPPAEKPKPEPSKVEVPDLTGMRVLEAISALRKAELQWSIEWGPTDEGFLQVIEQDPEGGTEVDPGSVVKVTFGLPSFLFGGAEVQPLPAEPPSDAGDAEVTPLPAPDSGAPEAEQPDGSSMETPTP
jgi:serine/threonine-protein kinase